MEQQREDTPKKARKENKDQQKEDTPKKAAKNPKILPWALSFFCFLDF